MHHLKDFTTTFDTLSRHQNRGRVFADFVEIAACAAHQVPYHAGALPQDEAFHRVERSYLDAIKRYDKAEIGQIVTLYATASLGVIENRADFLGTAYMQLEIANQRSGQFFTPPEVSRLMADMTFTGMEAHINAKGYIAVDEPAAGGGGMLIEAANAIQRLGFDPRATLYFRATDVDRTCFNMAYFQLSTLGLCGEVIQGNSLSLEEWDRRPTPPLLIAKAGHAPPAAPATPPEADAATVSPTPGSQQAPLYATPPMSIGNHEWRMIVHPSRHGGNATAHQWRRLGADAWRDSQEWPGYNPHDGTYEGLPKSLTKLYARHQGQIAAALEGIPYQSPQFSLFDPPSAAEPASRACFQQRDDAKGHDY
jgi:hypothetical protein